MAKTIYTESLIETWEKERYLWDLNSVIFKTATKKRRTEKKLAEQFNVVVLVLAPHTSLNYFSSPAKFLTTRMFFIFSYFFSQVVRQL